MRIPAGGGALETGKKKMPTMNLHSQMKNPKGPKGPRTLMKKKIVPPLPPTPEVEKRAK
ncbi:hypothetical protein BGX38DRAFT_1163014 [Terfezia claveryi]|nr:hypothetical protein BGX38DRAFT_1163014 [Terfezia claveryi]